MEALIPVEMYEISILFVKHFELIFAMSMKYDFFIFVLKSVDKTKIKNM